MNNKKLKQILAYNSKYYDVLDHIQSITKSYYYSWILLDAAFCTIKFSNHICLVCKQPNTDIPLVFSHETEPDKKVYLILPESISKNNPPFQPQNYLNPREYSEKLLKERQKTYNHQVSRLLHRHCWEAFKLCPITD